jgi:DNA invertase Pin-like site-specific DNA recombinase
VNASDTSRRRRRQTPTVVEGVIAYVRVSTEEQAASGAGLEAQRAAITAEAERRGLPIVVECADEGMSGSRHDRPGLNAALDALDSGAASVLMVAKLDRLSRSVPLLYDVMDRSRRNGWALVALDLGVDTTTPAGEMMSGIASVFAQFERRLISQRTKDALAVRKAQGVQLGRPRTLSDEARARIVQLRDDGLTWRAVADAMTAECWPTGHGGTWLANTARRIYLAEHVPARSTR